MDEKDTEKGKFMTASTKLSADDYEKALYIMRSFGIKTISALIRELIREMYYFLKSEEKQDQGGGNTEAL